MAKLTPLALRAAAFAFGLGVALPAHAQSPGSFSTLSTTGAATLNGDVLACSGHPWIDVRCPSMAGGAVGDDAHDDTAAFTATIAAAIAAKAPMHIPAGTYKVTSTLTIDYAGIAASGFRLVSDGATIDGRTIAGPVLRVECGGGTPASPTDCFYFREEGTLFVDGAAAAYTVVLGKTDFSDAQNSAKFDHLVVNNASTGAAAGGCKFNYVLDSDIDAVCVSAGGAAGLAFEQTQFSRISGAGTAAGTGGRGVVLENGYDFSNTFFALDLEVSPTCLSITTTHDGQNSFISPYFDCTTAVNATASTRNLLINPNYGGAVANRGPQSSGITVVGGGNWVPWQFPAAASLTLAPIDDGTQWSSYNATGSSLTVTLPSPAAAGPGWRAGFATDNGKGMTVTAPSGSILASGKSLPTVTLGSGNYQYLRLECDGTNFRVTEASRNTRLANGIDPPPWPSNWLYPTSSGYAASLADDGNILSSYNTGAGLSVTLPSTTDLPTGWSMGFATDNDKSLAISVNATAGGHLVWPGSGAAATSLSLADTSQGAYEFLTLQYDGSGNFRVVAATPATAQALGMIGSASISHWTFPSVSAYAATAVDNGNVVSSFNSPLSYLTVTLPSTTGLPMGWTIGLTSDSNKTISAQVNGTAGGRILYPGSGATTTSVSLARGDYEFLALRFDGSNFRVTEATPATATAIGMTGAAFALDRWNFPSAASYAATLADMGNVLSSYNTSAGLTVTLPSTTAIAAGWIMGFATDNGKPLTVEVNGTSGGDILEPARGGTSVTSVTLAGGQNYEFMAVQFDGANFRIVSLTPQTLNQLGGLLTPGTPASGSAACNTGQLAADSNYLYFCTAPNTWKRAALSSF
jgi:hypothetical protein